MPIVKQAHNDSDQRLLHIDTSPFPTTILAQVGDTSSGLTFVIGGPHGTSDAVKQRADMVLRLSSMVLNHQVIIDSGVLGPCNLSRGSSPCQSCLCNVQVAHVVLLEQIYRGWTILRGEPYHH